MGWVRRKPAVAPDLDGVLQEGDLDLVAPVGLADEVGRAGEADGAVLVDLSDDDGVSARSRGGRGEGLTMNRLVELGWVLARVGGNEDRVGEDFDNPLSRTTSTFWPA